MEFKLNLSPTNVEEKRFLMIGITSTWTALQVPVFGVQISLFNVIIMVAAGYHLAKVNQSHFFIRDLSFLLFLMGTVVSCFSCLFFLNQYWFSESFKATMKFLLSYRPSR